MMYVSIIPYVLLSLRKREMTIHVYSRLTPARNALNILPSYTDYFSLTTTTLALNTSAVWLGGCLAGMFFGLVTDYLGRKNAMLIAALLTIFAAILQAASQNVPMFVISRILIGLGMNGSATAGPVYIAETLKPQWRGWGLGLFFDFYYIGGLISAGVTYGTARMQSTWAWRLPSALQGLFSILCIVILPFIPESPRWLIHKGRNEEAMEAIALACADGNKDDPIVQVQYQEIIDTLAWEKEQGETLSLLQTVKTPSARKRMMLSLSVAVFTMLSGNNIISYYLGTMLTNAGITDSTTQLEIVSLFWRVEGRIALTFGQNIILNAWCLVICLFGTSLLDILGRKSLALWSTGLLTIFIFMIGGLTAGTNALPNLLSISG